MFGLTAGFIIVSLGYLEGESLSQIVTARVWNQPNNWHVLTGFCLIGLFYYLCYANRKDPYWLGKSILMVLSFGILCEFIWNLFYLSNVYQNVNLSSLGSFYLGLIWEVYIIVIGYIFLKEKFLRILIFILPFLLLYFSLWDLAGFHVSLSIARNPFYTIYQYNVAVNLTEIGQWIILSLSVGMARFFIYKIR